MAGQSNQFTPITFSAVLPLKNGIFTANMPPPPDTAWLQSIWGSVSKQANFVIKNIFLYPHFCQHKLWTYLLGNSLNSGRFHTKIGMNFWKTSNFKRPLRPPSCPRFRKLCCAFSNEIFRIGLTPLSDSV